MKISILFLFSLALTFGHCYAQNNVYSVPGNVTISPDLNGGVEIGPTTGSSATPFVDFHFGAGVSQDYNVRLVNSSNNEFTVVTNSGGAVFFVKGSNVGVGTSDTKGYKFAVNGTAVATSMTVKPFAAWPDYVFTTKYALPPLPQVNKYIQLNHHLPEIPSAQDINQNGVNLGEMNALLLKKVEELTLYLINQDKEQKEMKDQLLKMQKQLTLLKKRKLGK